MDRIQEIEKHLSEHKKIGTTIHPHDIEYLLSEVKRLSEEKEIMINNFKRFVELSVEQEKLIQPFLNAKIIEN